MAKILKTSGRSSSNCCTNYFIEILILLRPLDQECKPSDLVKLSKPVAVGRFAEEEENEEEEQEDKEEDVAFERDAHANQTLPSDPEDQVNPCSLLLDSSFTHGTKTIDWSLLELVIGLYLSLV